MSGESEKTLRETFEDAKVCLLYPLLLNLYSQIILAFSAMYTVHR